MRPTQKKSLLVGGVLLATHLATAAYYYERFAAGDVREGPAGALTLDLSPEQWIRRSCVRDPAAYLRPALNVAAGQGMTVRVPGSNPPRTEPFSYWGPGAPFVFGWWLRLFGDATMQPLFWFAVISQLAFGAISIVTTALWTRNTAALAATAFFTGCCPPLQEWFYSSNLTSSELVGLVPLAAMMFALSKAFLAFRAAAPPTWQSLSSRPALVWFAVAGLCIGVHSLIRDSGHMFAWFVAGFLVFRAMAVDRRRLALAIASALLLTTTAQIARFPIERWNLARLGLPMVSGSGPMAIWRYGLWVPPSREGIHGFVASVSEDLPPAAAAWFEDDLYRWCVRAGFGLGYHLDPESAKRVENHYQAGDPHPALYSLGQLSQAAAAHPLEAIEFKAKRLPVLWLNAGMWPDLDVNVTAVWCLASYALLVAYLITMRRRRLPIPESIYLYAALVFLAMPLIHFEFRYTFPVWNALVLVPGLMIGMNTSAVRKADCRERTPCHSGTCY